MVFVNKAVLISAPKLPVTFLVAQLSIAVVLLHITALFSSKIAKDVPTWDQIIPLTKENWRGLWQVIFVNAIGLLFNTLCLRGVDATFFQIARGLVLPLTIISSAIYIRARPSFKVVLAATGVTFGFLIGVAPSINPAAFRDVPLQTIASDFTSRLTASPLSLFYGVLSSVFIALHAVWIKSSLPVVDNSAIALAWWSNFMGVIILFPIAILNGEVPELFSLLFDSTSDPKTFLVGTIVTGIVGFFLCISSLISIVSTYWSSADRFKTKKRLIYTILTFFFPFLQKVTSPITHMFSSAARSVLQTLLGVWVFGDLLTV
jgi:solute carrier family 35 (GDP-fucose transporter), member C1